MITYRITITENGSILDNFHSESNPFAKGMVFNFHQRHIQKKYVVIDVIINYDIDDVYEYAINVIVSEITEQPEPLPLNTFNIIKSFLNDFPLHRGIQILDNEINDWISIQNQMLILNKKQ